jgi:hypothetical protein
LSVAAETDALVEQLSSLYSPTASVSPESAIDEKGLKVFEVGALTYAWKLHVVPDRVYT